MANIQKTGLYLFAAGIIVMLADVIYGRTIQDEVAMLGLDGIRAKHGDAGGLRVLLFAFGWPLGAALALLGAALFGGTAKTRAGRFGGIAFFVVLVPIVTPGLFGAAHSPAYFGWGGVTIMVLASASLWFWGHHRMRLSVAQRPAADWQGLGLLAFVLAAWNLCGFGGMPSFAVYPEKMIALNAIPFAVGQLKAVMALFILGFLFTVLGLREAARSKR